MSGVRAYLYWFYIILVSYSGYHQDLQNTSRTINLPDVPENTWVYTMIQDSKGFVWIGTSNGLYRYDGVRFKTYRNRHGDPNSLADDSIRSLLEDKEGNIWIGTESAGVQVLDPKTDIFKRYSNNPDKTNSQNNYLVTSIFQDSHGTIWIANHGAGLSQYIPETDSFKFYQNDQKDTTSILQNYPTKIVEDKKGYLWIGLDGYGVDRFHPPSETFKHYKFEDRNLNATQNFRNNVIRDMYDDGQGNIWLATYGGFNKLEKSTGFYTHFDKETHTSIVNNSMNSLKEYNGLLYITSYYGQLYTFDPIKEEFIAVDDFTKNLNTSLKDRQNGLWIGTGLSDVIYIGKPKKINFHRITDREVYINAICKIKDELYVGGSDLGVYRSSTEQFIREALSDQHVINITEGPDHTIWIATNSGGLNIYHPETGKVKVFRFEPNNKLGLPHDTVLDIYKDEFGDMWISTKVGLAQWQADSETFINRGRIQFSDAVRIDKEELWAANTMGIAVLNPIKNTFYMKQASPVQHTDSLLHNKVNVLYTRDKDSILIGTKKGLNLYVKSTKKMINLQEEIDMPYQEIFGITQDHHDAYWLLTDRGVLQMNLAQKAYKTWDQSNGIYGVQHPEGHISFDTESKNLYIAGTGGYYEFVPEKLSFDQSPVSVELTNFEVLNAKTSSNPNWTYKSNESEKVMVLDYDQNVISFEFAAIQYSDLERTKYTYRLVGNHSDWIETSNPAVTYTNLSPGTYDLQIKATNIDGVWNQTPTTFSFIVKPPYWATWWAYVSYIILIILILYGVVRSIIQRQRLKNKLLAEHLELEKMQEISQLKSRFFANVSHEFRTPLTLITGPVQDLIEQTRNPLTKKTLHLIYKNTQKLQQLIDQLLDYSKVTARKLPVKTQEKELYGFLRAICSSFSSLADRKKINYEIQIPYNTIYGILDADKTETIISNLISNALKFTPDLGAVHIKAAVLQIEEEGELQFTVIDTGPGLSAEQQEMVFKRFYRVNELHEGTGIGLALAKELTDLLGGTITVSGEPGKGSEFSLILPVQLAANNTEKKLNGKRVVSKETEGQRTLKARGKNKQSKVLIVEDHEDLRKYIKDLLDEQWKVLEAEDGEVALQIAKEEVPDVIISDFMMPKMEGDELCRQIRADISTSHIPFIMLTAKATQLDKIESLKDGVTDYMIKPFDKLELKLKVDNILKERGELQHRLQQQLLQYPDKDPELRSQEDRFIQKLRALIMGNLNASDLNVQMISMQMGLSRVQLYRKVLAITGMPTSEFIKKLRIRKSEELLNSKWGSISEIAYEVGFNNLSYYTKCFKEEYGITPSDYIKNQ